ncbi:membrane protein [Streptomyces sp. AS58]|nr:membrane protein [Streptomyces sp. AS58]
MYRGFVRPQDDRAGSRREPGSMSNSLRAPEDTAAPGARATARLPLLDVLRGAAILGTLMTNVWIFAAPGSEWAFLQGAPMADPFTEPAEAVFRFLADGKFLAMLTVLFGVGLAIQYDSAARRGTPWPRGYRPRALFLLAEGTLHFVLVFGFDVLMGYAVTALLVARLLVRSERVRRAVMWTSAGLHVALMSLITLSLLADPAAGGRVSAGAVDLYAHGSWLDQIAFRLENAVVLRLEPVLSFGLLVFLFLLGVRLHRAGAFTPTGHGRRLRARMAGWGLGLGIPCNAALTLGGQDFFFLGRYVAAPVVAVGYLGLIGVLLDRGWLPAPVSRGLTAVGRTALSCYVAQNLLCMLACYGLGLGLAERLADGGPWWVMGLWAAVSATLVTAATLWLRRFPNGPLESVQRRALRR